MERVICIAEIGLNWFGDIKLAKEMISLSKDCGADIVKFQLYRPKEILGINSPYLKDAERGVPTEAQARELKEYADLIEIEWCASVFHPGLVDLTEELGVKRYKIASRSVKDLVLLKRINETKKPVIMSVGMSDDTEISRAMGALRDVDDISLLYCVCLYPTNVGAINLDKLDKIRTRYQTRVGFSSHCPKIAPTLAAVARGATVIEHHVCMHRISRLGCDIPSSLNFKEFKKLIGYIRDMEQLNG